MFDARGTDRRPRRRARALGRREARVLRDRARRRGLRRLGGSRAGTTQPAQARPTQPLPAAEGAEGEQEAGWLRRRTPGRLRAVRGKPSIRIDAIGSWVFSAVRPITTRASRKRPSVVRGRAWRPAIRRFLPHGHPPSTRPGPLGRGARSPARRGRRRTRLLPPRAPCASAEGHGKRDRKRPSRRAPRARGSRLRLGGRRTA